MQGVEWEHIYEVLVGFNYISVAVRLLLAAVMGSCIGMERSRHGRAAGLRTHILVCLGASMTAILGQYSYAILGNPGDPLRVGAQVIAGIGFLGAGSIVIRNEQRIIGLTTAAGIWITAVLGLCVGIGYYWAALVSFLLIMLTISALLLVDHGCRGGERQLYYLELKDITKVNDLEHFVASSFSGMQIVPARSAFSNHVGVELSMISRRCKGEELLEQIRALDYVVLVIPVT